MLEFMRNKLVSVARKTPETLTVQAVLDDSIYSIEVDLDVRLSDLKCLSIEGRWKRWTTPECPKSLSFLEQATDFFLTPDVDDRIHKVIGRTSCRHFANLLIECAYAVQETAKLVREEELTAENVDVRQGENVAAKAPDVSTPAGPDERNIPDGDGFFVDLHLHTFPASKCASSQVDAMIEEAKRIGLNAICLTDHNHVWSSDDVKRLMDTHRFLIFRGNEIVTDQGDMLVFGFDTDIREVIPLVRLKQMVDNVGGFIAAAHPFRGFLTFGAGQLGLTPEKAMQREMFQSVHALEVNNGKVTDQENLLAFQVASGLGLPATGGSDAHDSSTVGTFATRFRSPVSNEEGLVAALHSGLYDPVAFRRMMSETV